jgi:excisionase family DNA binding protein
VSWHWCILGSSSLGRASRLRCDDVRPSPTSRTQVAAALARNAPGRSVDALPESSAPSSQVTPMSRPVDIFALSTEPLLLVPGRHRPTGAPMKKTITATDGDRRLIGVPEAAEYLGVSQRTIRNMLCDGRLKAYRLGDRIVRIRKSDIDAALEEWA